MLKTKNTLPQKKEIVSEEFFLASVAYFQSGKIRLVFRPFLCI
jgi:hypothetical protein